MIRRKRPRCDVRRILLAPDPTERAHLVGEHLQRLQDQLARTQAAVASLQRLLRPEPAGVVVELRQAPARRVAAVRGTVTLEEVLSWYAGAMAELDAVVGAAAGPPGGLYDNALFSEGRGDVLVYVPVAAPVPDLGRVRGTELPPAELAVTVHPGAHDTIDVT
ncbi:GyrI-like domain-containing protein [Streptomyces galbus]|uniref:GyrI-like domain-containing protein n=1 Tax=Streptomyces galbus TaxID=33898 RepID=UPI001B31B002|nr:GyrI-like domain-containing protein [Streptomyces galbus]